MNLMKFECLQTNGAGLAGQTQIISRNRRLRPGLGALLVFFFFGMTAVVGCQWPGQPHLVVAPGALSPADLKAHDEAVNSYLARDYAGAAQRFDAIRAQTGNPTIARMALYGLACSRLMAAETPGAHANALALWQAWLNSAPDASGYEDARLFAPIIRDKMIFSHIPLDIDVEPGTGELVPTVPKWFVVEANQALRQMTNRLDAAGQQMQDKDQKIQALEKEIERLNQQIEAFEKIDQRIQERKSAIPSTE